MARPEFKPTSRQRQEVEILAASRTSVDDIATAIGVSAKTLRLHFSDQLLAGRARRQRDVVVALYNKAIAGNVGAMKTFLKLCDRADAKEKAARPSSAGGKKLKAQQEALDAEVGTSWAKILH